ncbi:MAG TPA: hydantoinase/oxoprolinase family protein [Gemmatimonadaceae bacterium]|nr:hydantoinase/oxoprolinase family protein [Gemmatimonadaceae bacterium]
MSAIIGWDIGGVNTKVARIEHGTVRGAISEPFEIQYRRADLPALLARLAVEMYAADDSLHAVTMTAELSQLFRTKREGVSSILDAVAEALPDARVRIYTVDGRFLTIEEARQQPFTAAASNWAATARVVARTHPDAMLIDVGTTTTDIIPIAGGEIAATGLTDADRLRECELLYLGALRTPVEAITQEVPFRGGWAGVSAEGFAIAGDVYVWLGDLDTKDYTVATPDRRPVTRHFARERLARIICADCEQLADEEISAIAEHVAEAALTRVAASIARVQDRHPRIPIAITTGLGEFLATRAAQRLGLRVTSLAAQLGPTAARLAPAAAVALLLEEAVATRTIA